MRNRRYIYSGMALTKADRVHIRIEDEIKEGALAVVRLRGASNLTNLVTGLLKEEINRELKERPEMFNDELKKVRAKAGGIKRKVPVGLPANVAERNHARKTHETKALARKRKR